MPWFDEPCAQESDGFEVAPDYRWTSCHVAWLDVEDPRLFVDRWATLRTATYLDVHELTS
jgi:hypothetical protein